jgi:hydrogenase maturation protein HypF
LAISLANELNIPSIGIQHHHAHVAAVMAEYGISEPVIGLALDGVGLGIDGIAWGGELLLVEANDWQRLGHLWPLTLPGGDIAAREPWRMAASALHVLGRTGEIKHRFESIVGKDMAYGLQMLLQKGINCPVTTSAGRLFDAVAGLLGVSIRQASEAEAAINLEKLARQWIDENGLPITSSICTIKNTHRLDTRSLLEYLVLNHTDSEDVAELAAWFHINFADALAGWICQKSKLNNIFTVCLGGGCFLNSVLKNRVTTVLESNGLRVFSPQSITCGDAALALGQAWVAARALQGTANVNSRSSKPIKIYSESELCA